MTTARVLAARSAAACAVGLLTFVMVSMSGQSRADVYLFQDGDGVEHYTNSPVDDRYQLVVAVLQLQGVENRAAAAPVSGAVALYAPHVETAAAEFNVDKALVHAVITAESGYNASAVSRAGAQGLMQLMPQTARRLDVADAFDPEQNIRGGTRYLRMLLDMFDNDMELAVAAYNAGENAVIKYGRQIPPYRETKAYVPKVLALYNKYRRVF
jgi:soluble lytic murein transglycosylase-like protein